jgi:hypothetical protein
MRQRFMEMKEKEEGSMDMNMSVCGACGSEILWVHELKLGTRLKWGRLRGLEIFS